MTTQFLNVDSWGKLEKYAVCNSLRPCQSCETNYINPKSSIESGLQDKMIVRQFNDVQLT